MTSQRRARRGLCKWSCRDCSYASALPGFQIFHLATNHGCCCAVVQMRFKPQVDGHGRLQLFSLGHDGMYISDERSLMLAFHVRHLPHSIVLQNSNHQQHILVPSFPLARPRVRSLPLSTHVIPVRSGEWAEKVQSRVFVYAMHTCGEFLQISSLSSTLYLLMLRLMSRDYQQAAELLATIAPDTTLTQEQVFLVDMIRRTAQDCHPDAHACRLKLAHAVKQSYQSGMKWDVLEDFGQYLKKLSAVSAACKLSSSEEAALLNSLFVGQPKAQKHASAFDLSMRVEYHKHRAFSGAARVCSWRVVLTACAWGWIPVANVRRRGRPCGRTYEVKMTAGQQHIAGAAVTRVARSAHHWRVHYGRGPWKVRARWRWLRHPQLSPLLFCC